MSSPETRNRRMRRKAKHVRVHVPKADGKEQIVSRLLLMAVDAAGGTLRIPPEYAKRVTTLRMSLVAKELPAEEGGGTLLLLEVREPDMVAQAPVG